MADSEDCGTHLMTSGKSSSATRFKPDPAHPQQFSSLSACAEERPPRKTSVPARYVDRYAAKLDIAIAQGRKLERSTKQLSDINPHSILAQKGASSLSGNKFRLPTRALPDTASSVSATETKVRESEQMDNLQSNLAKTKQPNRKVLSADDFLSKTKPCSVEKQLDLSCQSGEGHCSGVCAMIPVDIRPLVKKAYEDTDFNTVNPDPVCLPMLDDDGVLRRPTSSK